MSKIMVHNGKVDAALRTLKTRSVKDGSLKKLRERQEGYLKPGVKRRLDKKEAIKNSRRNNKRERNYN